MILRTRLLLVLAVCLGLADICQAQGPVHDPFFADFVMGRFRDPDTMALSHGFPSDLWLPATVDSVWVEVAASLLDPRHHFQDPRPVVSCWLGSEAGPGPLGEWADSRRLILDYLAGQGNSSPPMKTSGGLLRDAVQTLDFFATLAAGDSLGAMGIAAGLSATWEGPDASARRFIWDLRARALGSLTGTRKDDPGDPWPLLFELGPYDRQSGWAIWTAHRRERGLPLLGRQHQTRGQAAVLAGLSRSWLSSGDLDRSGFAFELKAGLGAAVLRKQERREFMDRYRHPPWDFQAQGWWLKGARSAAGGRPDRYEAMARDDHLRSGWRMDLWRRASERRLLQGDWARGLADLERAVGLARYGAGSRAMRTRVRQWVEQALALAVAQGADGHAGALLAMGTGMLPEDQQEVFCVRVASWREGTGCDPAPDPGDVRAGKAWAMAGKNGAAGLPDGSSLRLEYWRRWAALACGQHDAAGLDSLRAALGRAQDAAHARGLALDYLARRVAEAGEGSRPDDGLWDGVLAQEVFLARPEGGPAAWSLFPALRQITRDEPDLLHAWLGMALALQDLRAVVGLAVLIPDGSLPSDQKLPFLYPLPAFGPVRRALDEARNEPALLLGVARNESLFDPGARSRAGALGWMQIMPFHFDEGQPGGGRGWADPVVSIAKGDALLEENRRRYHGDPYTVVASYNAGPTAARRWWKQLGEGADDALYLSWIGYPETRRYVEKVLKDRAIYAGILASGPGSPPTGHTEQ